MSDNVGKKLIVRPTVAGFGVVVADCETCDPLVDYAGCIVVEVGAQYARAYTCEVGGEIAYRTFTTGLGRTRYLTADPGTIGT